MADEATGVVAEVAQALGVPVDRWTSGWDAASSRRVHRPPAEPGVLGWFVEVDPEDGSCALCFEDGWLIRHPVTEGEGVSVVEAVTAAATRLLEHALVSAPS